MSAQFLEVVEQFGLQNKTALVIGDLMLDRYLLGDVQRISPEAPVPVVLLNRQNENAGGAANVASNLTQLGISCIICGCVGEDHEADSLLNILQAQQINTQFVFRSTQRPTITKTRIMSSQQQIVRLDQESKADFSDSEIQQLQQHIQQSLAQKPNIVILSDYAKGLLGKDICQTVIQHCKQHNIPVLVDPKGKDYSKYTGATALTPNKKEAAEACHVALEQDDKLLETAQALRQQLQLDFLAVTRGEEGISLIQSQQTQHIRATAKQVFDVSGAGDTVIATLAAGMLHGLAPLQALELANIAAGVVVGKIGTVPIQREELLLTLANRESSEQTDKICSLPQLLNKLALWRKQKLKVVFTNGCFDLLHAGHVTYLEAARKTGDKLILGLNTDRSVQALKGPTRPVINERDRARVLAALEAVDAVVLFDEDTPLTLIEALKPDVIVKGDDYSEDQVVGGTQVKFWGGTVKLIPLVQGRSTSNILEKISR
jgi:D-beta-D-heptose 7-phosphate kinase/D-beta-D-heptose 1-phosphate adenosyltransferase